MQVIWIWSYYFGESCGLLEKCFMPYHVSCKDIVTWAMHAHVSRAMHKQVTWAAGVLTPHVLLYELGAHRLQKHNLLKECMEIMVCLMTFFIVLSLYMIVWVFTTINHKYFMPNFLVYSRNRIYTIKENRSFQGETH
jgi:hypothetical protein